MAVTPFSEKKFLISFIAWWLTWAGMQTWFLYGLGYSLQIAVIDAGVSNILLAGLCILISNNFKYYLPSKERYWYILILSLLSATAWLLIIKYSLPWLTTNENAYHVFLPKSFSIRFGIAFLLIGCMAMISVLWYSFEEQKASAKRKMEAEQLTKDAELYKLRQQLQPHFLFNSLNSINALINLQPKEAKKMVQQLSDFLRGTLKREEQEWIKLSEELQHVELYLNIEKVRFGNRLSTISEIDETSLACMIPPMLLQPLIENAIKFGLYDTIGEVTIRIQTTVIENILIISVQNPFDPETVNPQKGTGFGLRSIERRLYLVFARNDLLLTNANGHLFTTTAKIPQTLSKTLV